MNAISTVATTRPRPGIGLLTIARADKLNAIDPATDQAMAQALAALDQDAEVRCIVVTGAGDKAFCAGADIPTLLPYIQANLAAGTDDPQFCGATHRPSTGKPLIAAVNGIAFGGGLELALACDLRIASRTARFGLPEIKVGVLAGASGCTRLPRMLPAALAAEMILTGEPIDAQRALECGLVSRVVAPEALLATAFDLAETIAARAPKAVRACTALLREPRFGELQQALRAERQALDGLLRSQDAAEGIRAFAEKRAPVYRDL